MRAVGACRIGLLLFCFAVFQSCDADASSFGICDVGDVISSRKGSIVLSKGRDCTRVILAPKGWRIKFTLYEITMRDAAFYIHDGGTRIDTRNNVYTVGHSIALSGTENYFASSNAILLHTDRIYTNDNVFNATFETFPQPGDRCVCPATLNGRTVCWIKEEDTFYSEREELGRECKTTCQEGHEVVVKGTSSPVSASSVEMFCQLEKNRNGTTWKPKDNLFDAFDPNLVTCSKVSLPTQVISVFTFTYIDLPCADLNISLIENEVHGLLVRNATASYVGQCYKNSLENCTVQPVTTSCTKPFNLNISFVKMEVRDNIGLIQNLTTRRMQYNLLVNLFRTTMKDQIEKYVTSDLAVNGKTATAFGASHPVFSSCPDGQATTGLQNVYPPRSCIPCPLHYYKHNFLPFYFSSCQKCSAKQRRQLNESRCVNGSKVYPKLSHSNCFHMCPLGKFFNNDSGLCEWCDYGQFQNSTTDINPVCQRCPAGNTTAFVGVKKEADCMKMCRKGQFVKHPLCIDCAIGSYMPFEGNRFQKCYQCPSGKTTLNVRSVNLTDCVDKCSQGEYFNITQGTCVLCPNNTFQDEVKASNARSCKRCPANSFTLSIGSTSSTACLGPCTRGEYISTKSRKCEQCPLNTYNDQRNHTSLMCMPCPKHKITQGKGSLNVSQCIYRCTKGEFFNVTSEKCEKCANNTYQDKIGQGRCKSCTGKTFTLKAGSETCISPCQFGKFLNKSAEMCQDCPLGYFQNSSNYVSAMCMPCPMDYYAARFGSQNCTACPDHGVTVTKAVTDSSECIERCSSGFFLNKTARVCQKCLKGFYQDQEGYRYESCTKCPSLNLTTLDSGAVSLEQCVGYCASSPCLNGAECFNIDNDFNCSCPQHLKGKRCEMVIDKNITDKMEISVRFPNLVWNSNLSNRDSKEFKDLARPIENSIREKFKNDATFRTVQVMNFKQGSVVSVLEFYYVAGRDFGNPLDTLKTAVVNGTIGNFSVETSSVKILKYTCRTPLGMENGRIPDNALSTSSPDNYHPLRNARLNHNGPGWTPRIGLTPIDDVYLQVDFGEELQLTGIATQGSSYDGGNWLQAYHITYSVEGKTWMDYKEDTNQFKVFGANTDKNTVVRNNLKYPVRTRYVRIFRQFSTRALSFRCEFYGCPIPKEGMLPTLAPPRTDAPTQRSTSSPVTRTSAASTTSEGTRSTVSKSDDDDDNGSNTGLIVGLVLGILALFILIGVAVWYFNKQKRSHSFGGVTALPMKEAY